MKRIVRRKLQIPANVQPILNPQYSLTFDKGTEEVTLIFTRMSYDPNTDYTGSISIKTKDSEKPFNRDLVLPEKHGVNNSTYNSRYVYTFNAPTLFHSSLTWEFYINPVQSEPITIDIISLINDNEYFYD